MSLFNINNMAALKSFLLSGIILLFAWTNAVSQRQIIDKVICEVGNEVILLSDLAEQIKLMSLSLKPTTVNLSTK